MAETATAPTRTTGGDGAGGELKVRPVSRSRRQAPWLVLAVLLIAGGGLTVAVLVSDLASRTPVIAVAADLERGDRLVREDLQVVSVALDGQVPAMTADRIDEVVGRTLTASLPQGSLLSPEMLSRADGLPDDADVVGMLLEPGAYPVGDLAAGDLVRVIAAPVGNEAAVARGWLTDAHVYAVEEPADASATLFISLLVPADAVGNVTEAAAAGHARLVLTGAAR